MSKNKSDSSQWKPKEKKPSPRKTGQGESQMEGPARMHDGRAKYLYGTGKDVFNSGMPEDGGASDWSPASLPPGGQTIGKFDRPRRHLPARKGDPGP